MLAVTGEDPQYASPGVLGFLVVFLMAVATYLLIRSMVGHLRKMRYGAEHTALHEADAPPATGAAPAVGAPPASAAAPQAPADTVAGRSGKAHPTGG